jgi:hypothetical protein
VDVAALNAHTLFVTAHALDRVRAHHPGIGVRGVLLMLADSEQIEGGALQGLLDRQESAARDAYFLAPDRWGLTTATSSGKVRA